MTELSTSERITILSSKFKALFASHGALVEICRDSEDKLRISALSLSKYLTVVYTATFLFLISSHESIGVLTGGRGPVLWSAIIVLICILIETKRLVSLHISTGSIIYIREVLSKLKEQYDSLDDAGKNDFPVFLDQLTESFINSAIKEKAVSDLELFKAFFSGQEEIDASEEEDRVADQAIEKLLMTSDTSGTGLFQSTQRLGEVIGKAIGRHIAGSIVSGLVFILYLFGLSIPMGTALIHNHMTLFSGLYALVEFVTGFLASFFASY